MFISTDFCHFVIFDKFNFLTLYFYISVFFYLNQVDQREDVSQYISALNELNDTNDIR
jgi:hypothetical protein